LKGFWAYNTTLSPIAGGVNGTKLPSLYCSHFSDESSSGTENINAALAGLSHQIEADSFSEARCF